MTASKFADHPFKWQEIQKIIENNELELFARSKSQIEKYHDFKKQLISQGTTVFKHLVANSLQWCDETEISGLSDSEVTIRRSNGGLFENADDLKIIHNDFPYYLEDNITHLCVWSKQPIKSDPSSVLGDISPETRAIVEKYVCDKFVTQLGIPREDLVWFRNWEALQSVKEISHIHVLIRNMTSEQLEGALSSPM